MANDIIQTEDYRSFTVELKSRVQAAQIKAAVTVNRELLLLYWDLGKMLTERLEASGWGDGAVEEIGRDLGRELGGLKGFSRANLYWMKCFSAFYREAPESVAQAVRQIPWDHNILIFQKTSDPWVALWYVAKAIEFKTGPFEPEYPHARCSACLEG